MKLNKVQTDAFAKILKRGMEHYGRVPYSIGNFQDPNKQGVVGYVVWEDKDANFEANDKTKNQEFYITSIGDVCVYVNKVFIPLDFKITDWKLFANNNIVGSEK